MSSSDDFACGDDKNNRKKRKLNEEKNKSDDIIIIKKEQKMTEEEEEEDISNKQKTSNIKRRRKRKRKVISSMNKNNFSNNTDINKTDNLIMNLLENDICNRKNDSKSNKENIIEIVPIGRSGGIISSSSSSRSNGNICVKKTSSTKIKLEKNEDDSSSSCSSNKNNLELLGKESIIDTNTSNKDSIPSEVLNFLTFSDERKQMQGFTEPDERYVTSNIMETISNTKRRCKICYWALSGKLYSTYMPRNMEDINNLCSINNNNNNNIIRNNTPNEIWNGISFLLSIRRWYKMLSDFSQNSEVYASVANLWNSQVDLTRIKLKKRVWKIYNKNNSGNDKEKDKRGKNDDDDDDENNYTMLDEIQNTLLKEERKINDDNNDSIVDISNTSSKNINGGITISDFDDQQNLEEIFGRLEKMVGIPPYLNVCDVEYHVKNCISDIDIQLRGQFKLFAGLNDHILKNTLFNMIVDADIDASTIDLSDESQNFNSSSSISNGNNDGLKRTQIIDYVELQKLIMISTQNLRIAAELRARKEKINFAFSELSLLSSMKTAQMIKDNSEVGGLFGRINMNNRLRTSTTSNINNSARLRNGRGKTIIRNGNNNNILDDDVNRDFNTIGSLTKI